MLHVIRKPAGLSKATTRLSRRGFLMAAGGVGIGLVVGFGLAGRGARAASPSGASAASFNPFVAIAPDGTVTVLSKHLDKGQGTATGLATLVAEELDARWDQMRAEFAPSDPEVYKNLFFGVQGTGGSTAMANSFEQYRKAGAAARAMLVAAAAQAWGVPAAEITVAVGELSHAASGKRAGFGAFAEAASALPAPTEVTLKDPSAFVHIGKSFPRLDVARKTEGADMFTLDFTRPGMLVAAVCRPPRFGAKVASFDQAPALAVPGVVGVVQIPSGVAVLATGTWAAFRGRDALPVTWDETAAEMRGTDALLEEFRAATTRPGAVARKDGDSAAALAGAAQVIEAEFEFPYLAHAALEPLNVVIQVANGEVDIWAGSQLQTVDHGTAAGVLGLPMQAVRIHTLWAGGSFGRRAVPDSHMVAEAAQIAKAWGRPDPIKVQWSREDDMTGGYYRPLTMHRVRAGLDASGRLVGWEHRIASQSIMKGTPFEAYAIKDGVDSTAVEGAADTPYAIPNMTVEYHMMQAGVPVLWWRAVGHTHTAYVMEAMMDALARAAGRDPLEFRLDLLGGQPRQAAVLRLAAEKAGWGGPLPEGHFHGIAVHESFNSHVAEVAEIAMRPDGGFRVVKVTCAVDCGLAINPDNIRAQMEGGIGYGLGHALRDEITLTDGVVDQANFDLYEPMRLSDMPEVEVHIVASDAPPTGVGEPGTPPIAPAVANAILAATGEPVRRLPLVKALSARG